MNEKDRRELDTMPFDKRFDTPNGDHLCHATGDEVLFDDDPVWWNEYIDSEGNLYSGN